MKRLRKWVKYLILGVINGIVLINLPLILKDANESINDFRYNWLVIFTIIIINAIAIAKIEK